MFSHGESCARYPLFASLGGFGGLTFSGGKSHAAGMVTKKRIPKALGVLAETGGIRQAFAKINKMKLGNLAIRSVFQILKFVHLKSLSFNEKNVKSVISFCVLRKRSRELRASGTPFLRLMDKCHNIFAFGHLPPFYNYANGLTRFSEHSPQTHWVNTWYVYTKCI